MPIISKKRRHDQLEKNYTQRLTQRELGPYAFETCMPVTTSRAITAEDDRNKFSGVIPKLCQLLDREGDVDEALLCTPAAIQVCKIPDEGRHFCGYRNIQMLLLCLNGHARLSDDTQLTIPYLQDMIERAWDRGYNSHGRAQTGGIRGTRKHIGTPEAEALLLSLNIPCTGNVFSGKTAEKDLLDFVEAYFANPAGDANASGRNPAKTHTCAQPPIFMQRPRHSLTIVGLEKAKNGKRRLIVFDPAWKPPVVMRSTDALPMSVVESSWSRKLVLSAYRKSRRYLRRFDSFETLSVDSSG